MKKQFQSVTGKNVNVLILWALANIVGKIIDMDIHVHVVGELPLVDVPLQLDVIGDTGSRVAQW